MPAPNYIELIIAGERADIDSDGPVPSVTYVLEDDQDFEQKKSAESFDIELVATLNNDRIHNSFQNPSVLDNTSGQQYENYRPCVYMANGQEILVGKYLLQDVMSKNGRPEKYTGKIYGLNGDWVIDLKEKTLFDFLNPLGHVFDAPAIIASWQFDGRSEHLDFVYAPVRYLKRFGAYPDDDVTQNPLDDNALIEDMKPSISVYWLLYRGFRSVGYRIVSNFMDTDYYRRGVMPWTWGGFNLMDDTRWEPLKFLAHQEASLRIEGDYNDFPDLSVFDTTTGAYDNNNVYTYQPGSSTLPFLMTFTYPTTPAQLNLGRITVNLSVTLALQWKLQQNSNLDVHVLWYKNGVEVFNDQMLDEDSDLIGPNTGGEFPRSSFETEIDPGDYIGARVLVIVDETGIGFARIDVQVDEFTLNFVRLAAGSDVAFTNYPKFKNYKWMDLLRGEIDLFDLTIQTDPIKKEVYIEPTHSYRIDGVDYPGYFNRDQYVWTHKVDYSRESKLELFSDYERELIFRFKEDSEDGGLKKVQDRNQVFIGQAKYLLPQRYKTEKKEKENRFFAATMHCDHAGFKFVTGIAPQMVALIPENVANTSATESENVFQPKRLYYKGLVTGVGGWRFNQVIYTNYPFMFAVNYKAGGDQDPVLSYGDQFCGGQIGEGLLKKFFLQRMAIFRHGRRENPIFVMLNNYDVANFLHRESIIIEDIEYILTKIEGFNPVSQESTPCSLWMFMPKNQLDIDNTYPSISSLQSGGSPANAFDVKPWPHILLDSDLP